MNTTEIGCFIADLRKMQGLTQKELAQKLMVTDKAISRWETGKGLPDTSLLIPLADALGVSVGELLSAKRLEEENMKQQTDRIIVESLSYSKKMSANIVTVLLLVVGVFLAVSPLYVASKGYLWIVGVLMIAAAVVWMILRKTGKRFKLSEKLCYLFAMLLQGAALVLEILPLGTVLIFADGPDRRITRVFSYFSLTPYGYANFTPLLTGILTAVILLLGILALIRFEKAKKCRNSAFVCTVLTVLCSLVPLLVFGANYMNAVSYTVTALLAGSAIVQAIANRKN